MTLFNLSILCLLGYLCGSVLFAPRICQALQLPSPLTSGSRNPGATNVYRLGGWLPAGLTLAGDAAKGALPVALAGAWGVAPWVQALIGIAAVIGHMFPVFHHFHGGKGVATALGVGLALAPATTALLATVWVTLAGITRISAVASITAALIAPVVSYWLNPEDLALFLLLSLAMLIRHRDNILRLWRGEEKRL
ncbi:glycerol-3-phosphate 1-O-acyltransferase PlsY [Marinobacteraceae bacterium S3BR75-40.1]